MPATDGRVFAPTLTAAVEPSGDQLRLNAPSVGTFAFTLAPGHVVTPGICIGALEVLGVHHRVLAPATARGTVVSGPAPNRASPVARGFGDVLCVIDPTTVAAASATTDDPRASAVDASALRFLSPLGGRFYVRPSPGAAAFVSAGDVVQRGQTVGLLEVMKTFNRIVYGGEGLPERAKIMRVVPEDESDIDAGDAILELAPA